MERRSTAQPRRARVFAALAGIVALVGCVLAAVALANPASHARAAHAHPSNLIAGASGYLGVSPAELRHELRGGHSLAAVAAATSGRSAAGLIDALVAKRTAGLTALTARLRARVTAQVERVRARARGPHKSLPAAYLGIPLRQLRKQVRSGRTLGQIADATPGHSRQGLIEAMMEPRLAALAGKIAAGTMTQAQEQRRAAWIEGRVIVLVDRVHPAVARAAHPRAATRARRARRRRAREAASG